MNPLLNPYYAQQYPNSLEQTSAINEDPRITDHQERLARRHRYLGPAEDIVLRAEARNDSTIMWASKTLGEHIKKDGSPLAKEVWQKMRDSLTSFEVQANGTVIADLSRAGRPETKVEIHLVNKSRDDAEITGFTILQDRIIEDVHKPGTGPAQATLTPIRPVQGSRMSGWQVGLFASSRTPVSSASQPSAASTAINFLPPPPPGNCIVNAEIPVVEVRPRHAWKVSFKKPNDETTYHINVFFVQKLSEEQAKVGQKLSKEQAKVVAENLRDQLSTSSLKSKVNGVTYDPMTSQWRFNLKRRGYDEMRIYSLPITKQNYDINRTRQEVEREAIKQMNQAGIPNFYRAEPEKLA